MPTDSATPAEEHVALPELDTYEVLAPIARGGMAEVFLGRLRSRPDRLVALKIMRPELCRNQEFVSMFLDEARIASGLAHPNIAAIYGLGHDHGHHYLAMELLRGRTLLDVVDIALRRGRRLPYEVVAWIGARIADALHYAHELRDGSGAPAQIVHRDVNPNNIFVTFTGEAKLIDFGLAKAHDRITSTAHGVLKGKLAYLAPEQVTGAPIDRRADVFALGVTLWEVSVGDRLFREDSDVETVRRVSKAEVPDPTTRLPDYPRALADVLLRALARSPNDRFRTARELSQALDAFVAASGNSVDARQVGTLVESLFPPDAAAPWEKMAGELERPSERDEVLAGGDLVRAWDDDAQKMTWMAVDASAVAGAIAAPTSLPTRLATFANMPWREGLESALLERLAHLTKKDAVARARALLELSLVDEWFGDGTRALAHVETSLEEASSVAAHSALRRLRHPAGDANALLAPIEAEIERVSDPETRADLLGERGRILQVAGDQAKARASFARALELVPEHAASLKGLEVVLRESKGTEAALAAHLGRMADAYDGQPTLAAWLLVERATLLDAQDDTDDAKSALVHALELDGGLGPVRDAAIAHAAAHRDAAWMAMLLLERADLETLPDVAAALELEVATVVRHRLADSKRAGAILEKARKRKVQDPLLRRIILDELVVLHERASRTEASLQARRERLSLIGVTAERAVELRTIAFLEEKVGAFETAVVTLEEARRATPEDETIAADMDRILSRAVDVRRRITLWTDEAAHSGDPERRLFCLLRAATIAEGSGDKAQAIELHRAALASAPANLTYVDAIDRLLRVARTEPFLDEVRARIALHRHAAEHASDVERRIAHLEVTALLEEEELAEPTMAAATHEQILTLAPGRRSALLGLARSAARAGDLSRSSRAILAEAELVTDRNERNALTVRAAELLANTEAERAIGLLAHVLAADAHHAGARSVKRQIHEREEQWTAVDDEMKAAIAQASDRARIDLLLARAELQRSKLSDRRAALETVHAVLGLDPREARAIALATTILEELNADSQVVTDLLALAAVVEDPSARARVYLRAANLAEHVVGDDVSAMDLVSKAIECVAEASWLEPRYRRIALRQARRGKSAPYELALEVADGAGDADATLQLALLRLAKSPEVAREMAERIAASSPTAPHALRLLERTASATGRAPLLANALSAQVEAFTAPAPRLGVLWEEIRLVEWRLGGDVRAELDAVRSLAPGDRAALDGIVRRGLAWLHAGHDAAREGMAEALRTLVEQAPDDTTRLMTRLALAFSSIPLGAPTEATAALRAALRELREALRLDPQSVVAAAGTARLGPLVDDPEATVAGLAALAEIASTAPRRAELLTQAAGALVAAGDGVLGGRAARLERAADILERALEADPEALLAATMLVGVRSEDGRSDRLLAALGAALERAKARDAIATLGMELARAARARPETRTQAVDALRRVVSVVTTDAAAWKALADVCLAQGARAEAAQALESVARHAREPREKMDALFGLMDLYRQSGSAADVERVLRVAIDLDPSNVRALRELAVMRRSAGAPREEITGLLARLADAAKPGEEKSSTFADLAEAQAAAGDRSGAEQSLVEAAAQAPSAARLARVLELHGSDANERARVLLAVVARGEQLGRPDAAAWASLGQIEVDMLKRPREGVAHLRRALALEPAMPEARAAMARGLVAAGQKDEAAGTVLAMLVPDAAPLLSLRDPGGALVVLETSLRQQGRRDESIVARELCALAGSLDDGAHVELRSRRRGAIEAAPGALDAQRLSTSVMPDEGRGAQLGIAVALAGVEAKIVRSDLESLDVTPRQRLSSSSGQPVFYAVQWLSRLFGIDAPPVVLSNRLNTPRALSVDGDPWLAAPSNLSARPEPEQIAALVRPLVRIALAMPWLDDVPPREVCAFLCGASRRAVTSYGSELRELDHDLADEYAQRIGRAIGRRQKKALSDLAPRLLEAKTITEASTQAFLRAVAQLELRTAFIVTGDLLATLDALRASDAGLAREMDAVGPRALGAALTHPLASDLVRFALGATATAMRTRLGTT